MSSYESSDLRRLKENVRAQARLARRTQRHKESLSRLICAKFAALPEYVSARTVLFYLETRSEVRTQFFVCGALGQGKRVAVPYCVDSDLRLFLLERMDDVAEGAWRILEPKEELRVREDKEVDVSELDLVMAPGVAFDRQGGRMGHGKGYYDRLLRRVSLTVPLVALAFECQVFKQIPMGQDDVYMDKIITERAIYEGARRRAPDAP